MSDKGNVIIQVEDFTAKYDDTLIIDNITFDVYQNEIFIILGGSGCGKSTLLKHMIGLYKPAHGNIIINGEDISKAEGQERIDILKKIGVAYQSGALFGSMTILENVMLPLEEYTDLCEEARHLIGRMKLELVGLEGSEQKMPSELSGGMILKCCFSMNPRRDSTR
jgi:phospholipid/cholesterol/gamma-HCH transport system ATP-binding protein